jgi:hypothetical protein
LAGPSNSDAELIDSLAPGVIGFQHPASGLVQIGVQLGFLDHGLNDLPLFLD